MFLSRVWGLYEILCGVFSSCSINLDYIHVTSTVYKCCFIPLLQASPYEKEKGLRPKADEVQGSYLTYITVKFFQTMRK
jgi:hypothetical protein